MKISNISIYLFHASLFIPSVFLSIYSLYGNDFDLFVYVYIYGVGVGITTLMSISDGSDRTVFWRKMERKRSVREEMDERVLISRQSRHLFLCK